MKTKYLIIIILVLLVGFNGKSEVEITIPTTIIEKSNKFIISQVGDDFFAKYISLNLSSSKYCQADEFCIQNPDSCAVYLQQPHYLMAYSFKIPDKPFFNETIDFAVDNDGNIITERVVIGIPNCLKEPVECNFPIDETRAIDISKGVGLEKGLRDWETSFHWFAGDLKTYVWTVSNTLSENRKEGSSSGKVVVIDANTGKVIRVDGWNAGH